MKHTTTIDYLTVNDMLARLRISRSTLRKATNNGSIPAPLKLGRSVRYRVADIQAWEEAKFPESPKEA